MQSERRLCGSHGHDFQEHCPSCLAYIEATDVMAAEIESKVMTLMSAAQIVGHTFEDVRDAQAFLEMAGGSIEDAALLLIQSTCAGTPG